MQPTNGEQRRTLPGIVTRLSTELVAPRERLAFWSDTLTAKLSRRNRIHFECPVSGGFQAAVATTDLNAVSILRLTGVAHRAFRSADEDSSDGPRTFSIILSRRTPWTVTHRTPLSMEPGDAVLIDSALGVDARFRDSYDVSHLKLSENWLRQWVPFPGTLVGRRLAAGSGWSGALASFVSQLSPELGEAASMPMSTMVDHIGALLSLAAAEIAPPQAPATSGTNDLHTRIVDAVRLCCTETELTVSEVAQVTGVSPRTVHRTLARFGHTYGELLIAARGDVALAMLRSPLSRRLTMAEIAHRSGFADPSHFSRIVRARFGQSPAQLAAGFGA